MEISIQPLVPESSDEVMASALALRVALTAEYDAAIDPDTEVLFRASLAGTETFEVRTFAAFVYGSVVALASIRLPHLSANRDKAEVEVEVHPGLRRQGIGSSLLRAAVAVVEADGRRSIAGMNVNSFEAEAFWSAHGAEQKMLDRQSRLWLAETDDSLMDSWIDGRLTRAGDYRLVHYRGVTPDYLLAASAELNTSMNDAPQDALDWEDETWSEADVRELDEMLIGRGRDLWSTMALGPGNEPAGLSVISIQHEKPRFAHQGNTVVHPTHRNRGIGRWLKADMWKRLRAHAPEVEAVETDNAVSNDPMLAINTAMGFVPLVDWGTWQADTSVLHQRL